MIFLVNLNNSKRKPFHQTAAANLQIKKFPLLFAIEKNQIKTVKMSFNICSQQYSESCLCITAAAPKTNSETKN